MPRFSTDMCRIVVSSVIGLGLIAAAGAASPTHAAAAGWYPYWPLGTGSYVGPGLYGYRFGYYGPGLYTPDYFQPSYSPGAYPLGEARSCAGRHRWLDPATGRYRSSGRFRCAF